MTWNIFNEDAIKWANEYDGELFHALLTDAPYHLTTIVKRFGKKDSAKAKFGKDGVFQRASKGFMGQTWDGGDIAFQPETWSAFGKVLYPGAFGMAFSASRNWHRMAVAIEDAGFIIHPTMFFLWVQGQGFPKATRVKGHEEFDGHRYGLQALKPAVEPIVIFQKPYEGKPVKNIVDTGAGVLNIGGGRIPLIGDDGYVINRFDDGMKPFGNGAGHKYSTEQIKEGRYPSNLILDTDSASVLDEQTGVLTYGIPSGKKKARNNVYGQYRNEDVDVTGFGDSGGASRFFFQVSKQIDETDPFLYQSKVSPKERNAGLDGLQKTELGHNRFDKCANCGGYILQNPDRPSACKCENPERENNSTLNPHPTVKPINLNKYLATILLPPVEYNPRRIFVPFSGVASEMIGACLAGWEEVVGLENDTENGYVEIAKKRLEYWVK